MSPPASDLGLQVFVGTPGLLWMLGSELQSSHLLSYLFSPENYCLKRLILCVRVFGFMYICAPCACSAHEGHKRTLDLLGLELQVAVSRYVGAGSPTGVL